jgi:hypothetical protein
MEGKNGIDQITFLAQSQFLHLNQPIRIKAKLCHFVENFDPEHLPLDIER